MNSKDFKIDFPSLIDQRSPSLVDGYRNGCDKRGNSGLPRHEKFSSISTIAFFIFISRVNVQVLTTI